MPDMLRYATPSLIPSRRYLSGVCWGGWGRKCEEVADVGDRNAPMFRSRGTRGRGVGLARGRATVNRARGQRGGRG